MPVSTKTSPPRRFGTKDSATRAGLVEAGIEVLKNEGAAAFTARRVAEAAGLKPQLVHYYFRTMEDLLLAIVDFAGGEGLKRAARAAASEEPLRELWKVSMDERSSALVPEVKSLAQNSEAVRQVIVRQGEQHRILMAEAVQHNLERRRVDSTTSAMCVVMILDAISRLLTTEKAIGTSLGHDELQGAVEHWLDNFYASQKLARV